MRVLCWSEHANPILSHLRMEAFISNIPHSKHSQLCISFLQEYRLYLNARCKSFLVCGSVTGKLLTSEIGHQPAC